MNRDQSDWAPIESYRDSGRQLSFGTAGRLAAKVGHSESLDDRDDTRDHQSPLGAFHMHRLSILCSAAVPAVILAMHVEHAPAYVAVLPGALIGLGIVGLLQKRRCA